MPLTPAICNAIYDAVGARLYTLPATPERILAAQPAPAAEAVLSEALA